MSNHLDPNIVGITVYCTHCQQQKKPIGRSAASLMHYCTYECSGYSKEPHVGDLWPGESEADFGHPVTRTGTRRVPPPVVDPSLKFMIQVQADASGTWCGNAVTFDTAAEAQSYAMDLYSRWMSVRNWRVVDAAGTVVVVLKPEDGH